MLCIYLGIDFWGKKDNRLIMDLIQVKNLTKHYGTVKALDEVSFSIKSGEIVGLLGPNGAGKTTLMKSLTGYIEPNVGDISIADINVVKNPLPAQQMIGYLPENAPLYPDLSVQSQLKMIADLRCIPAKSQSKLITGAVTKTGISAQLTRPIRELSKGYRQRVGIAQSILHLPRVLILDEPTAGLDPTQVIEIRKLIKELTSTSTILLSTHILSEVEAICDRVIVLVNGRVAADVVISELVKKSFYKLSLKGNVVEAKTMLNEITEVDEVIVDSNNSNEAETLFEIHYSEDNNIRESIYEIVQSNGWSLLELSSASTTLEQFFSELVGYGPDSLNIPLGSKGVDEGM